MLESGLAPYGSFPEASLPEGYAFGGALLRPVLARGGRPRAAVVLVTMMAASPAAAGLPQPVSLVSASGLGTDVALDGGVPVWTPPAFPPRGCILLRFSLSALAAGDPLGLLQADDGSDDNALAASIAAGGGLVELAITTAGIATGSLAAGTPLAVDVPAAVLLAWSPGAVRLGVTGAGVLSLPIARPPGLLAALLGSAGRSVPTPLGEDFSADLYPTWPSEAEAAALLAA